MYTHMYIIYQVRFVRLQLTPSFMNNFLQGILSSKSSSLLFLVVGLSMALTPWLAAGGQFLASRFEQNDVRSLLPVESEVRLQRPQTLPFDSLRSPFSIITNRTDDFENMHARISKISGETTPICLSDLSILGGLLFLLPDFLACRLMTCKIILSSAGSDVWAR